MRKKRLFRVILSDRYNAEFICGRIIGAVSALIKSDKKSESITEVIYKDLIHKYRYFTCRATDEEWLSVKEYLSKYDYDIKYMEIIEE